MKEEAKEIKEKSHLSFSLYVASDGGEQHEVEKKIFALQSSFRT